MANWGAQLPKNWEAKWDDAQQRYFYIDHITKTTSWQDPRLFAFPAAKGNAETEFEKGQGFISDHDATMQAKSWLSPPQEIDTTNETEATLQSEFPTAGNIIISDILFNVRGNEHDARQQLFSMGFKSVAAGRRSRNGRETAPHGRETAPHGRETAPHVRSSASPSRHEAAGKRPSVASDRRSQSPSLTSGTPGRHAQYKKQSASSERHVKSPSQSAKKLVSEKRRAISPEHAVSPARRASPERHVSPEHRSTTPVRHASTPSTLDVTTVTISSTTADKENGRKKSQERSTKKSSRQSGLSSARGPSALHLADQLTAAEGPDRSLAKGPNKSLLIRDYVETHSQLASNRCGAETTHHVGPDPANHIGPQCALRSPTLTHLQRSAVICTRL